MKVFPLVLALLLSVVAFAGPLPNEPAPRRIGHRRDHRLTGKSTPRQRQRAD
jgi:hypothetical protein